MKFKKILALSLIAVLSLCSVVSATDNASNNITGKYSVSSEIVTFEEETEAVTDADGAPTGDVSKTGNGYGSSTVSIHTIRLNALDITVPLQVAFQLTGNNVIVPDNYGITNKSNYQAEVTEVVCEDNGDYTFVSSQDDVDAAGEIYMTLNGKTVVADNATNILGSDTWVMAQADSSGNGTKYSLPITCSMVKANNSSNENLVKVTYTVALDRVNVSA